MNNDNCSGKEAPHRHDDDAARGAPMALDAIGLRPGYSLRLIEM
ncbi:hypothetical protein ACYX7E_13535 [Luteimonas sp. RIT-PG2_3]